MQASIGKYLKTVAETNTIPAILEGIDDRSPTFMESEDRVEIRINGPFTKELSAGYHRLYVDVNVLVNSMMGGVTKRAYTLDEILGVFHNAMDGAIAVYRFGTGPDDDAESLLGCLTPRPGKNDSIRVLPSRPTASSKKWSMPAMCFN
jgi:hypothetical protein